MVELIHFSKTYKNFTAVSDVSFSCEKGKITGILGPNGAGKTTVLKAICGRHLATDGSVLVENLNAAEETEKIRNLCGFVTEEPELPGEYNVFEYLESVFLLHTEKSFKVCQMPSTSPTITESCDSKYVPNLFEKLSLNELLGKKIKSLSKGQKQRVNFAQALIYNPKVLVLDEPATGLDPSQIIRMRKFVLSQKERRTVILSTHLMQEAEALCDEVLILNQGKIAARGTISEILKSTNSKNLEEAFFALTQGNQK